MRAVSAAFVAAQDRLTRCVLVGGILVWIANGVIRWWLAAPLGHDEARYALDAHDLVAGEPTRFLYSGAGMTLVALPGVVLGASERALRLVPLLLGTGFLVAAWYAAKRACGSVTAAWTVAVLAGSRTMTTHSAELLSDLPSAACMLVACGLLVGELGRSDGARWRVIAIGPLFAAAFYLRYGSAIPIAAISGAFLLVGYPAIARRPRPLIAATVLFVLLLVPHLIHSRLETGSIAGIVRMSADIPLPSTGFDEYLMSPLVMYGPVLAPLLLLGLVSAPRKPIAFALLVAAVLIFTLLTLSTYAQARYVYLPTVLLVLLGVDAVVWKGSRAIAVAATVVVVAMWALTFVRIPHHVRTRSEGPARTMTAAAIIAHDRRGEPCTVIADEDATRLVWYSGCRARGAARVYHVIRDDAPAGTIPIALLPGLGVYATERP